MRKSVILVFVLCLLPWNVFGETDISAENVFSTPEEAIRHFVSKISQNDLTGAFESCAIDDSAAQFRFTDYTKRLNAMNLLLSSAPSQYPMYVRINRIINMSKIASQIKLFCYSLLSDEEMQVIEPDDSRIDDFVKSVNPEKLSSLKIVKITYPVAASTFQSQRAVDSLKKQAVIYGADNSTERIVLIEYNGKLFVEGFHLLQYKKAWKIDSLSSSYSGNPGTGQAVETSEEDFNSFSGE